MIIPPKLQPGDVVGICAPARKISCEALFYAVQWLTGLGLKVTLGKSIDAEFNQWSCADKARAEDFQQMLNDPQVKAIWCARGGYGSVRMVDLIDFTPLIHQPKWIIGYSDVTVLLQHINRLGVAGLHGAMPIDFEEQSPEVKAYFKQILLADNQGFEFDIQEVLRKKNTVSGRLFGGNLSVLYSVLGSNSCYIPKHGILFLEDLDEHLYHIDRMFWALRRAGFFDGLKALLIGGMTDLKDNTKAFGFKTDNPFGLTLSEIVQQATAGFDFPVIFGFPVGHHSKHFPVISGAEVTLSIESALVRLNYI